MKKIKHILKAKLFQIILLIALDSIIFSCVSFLAILLRFDFNNIPNEFFLNIRNLLWLDILITLAVFAGFGLYISIWRYASVNELLQIVPACFISEAIIFLYKNILHIKMPTSYFIIHTLFMILAVSLIRYSYRIARFIYLNSLNKRKTKNTIIVGSGEAGRMLIDEISRNNNEFDEKIVCVIDDNKNRKGSRIKGIPIFGNRRLIKNAAEKFNADEIIIAIPSASKSVIAEIVKECQKTKCEIKILPSIHLSMNQRTTSLISNIRPLSYEDFLGRDQVEVNFDEIKDSLNGQKVIVTGGGGSIGSELCRQIAKCNPMELVIIDIYENNAYEIQQELLTEYPELNLHVIIGSVRDYDRMNEVFFKHQPDQVFHAAAHKHVPLMEVSPNEAVKNNCLGTLNICKLAKKYKTKKFVLISSDKAVRPTNVMGATKRICEMMIQAYDKLTKDTEYVAVRFGNVLGSNGSVIPLFLKQIENGGVVTVTHREVRRFFMTIPEAVGLVLSASILAKGGEIFVLDMGEPIKIYDLAEKLIRYKGLEPGKDVKIKISGLRPGEKLYEEILMDEEGLKETPNKLIHIGKPLRIPETFLKNLDDLIADAYKNEDGIKEKVAKIVTTYKIDKEGSGK